MYRCPMPGCSFTATKLWKVKEHFKLRHLPKLTHCPVCGEPVSPRTFTRHCYLRGDERHLLFYYLASAETTNRLLRGINGHAARIAQAQLAG